MVLHVAQNSMYVSRCVAFDLNTRLFLQLMGNSSPFLARRFCRAAIATIEGFAAPADLFFVEVELELAAWAAGAGFGDGADDFYAAGACFGAMQSYFLMYESLCAKGFFNVRSTKFVQCTKMSMYESIFVQMYEFENVLTPLSYSVSKCELPVMKCYSKSYSFCTLLTC